MIRYLNRFVFLTFALSLLPAVGSAAPTPTAGQLQKRIVTLEKQVKALLKKTNTIVSDQDDLSDSVNSLGTTTQAVQADVNDLKKPLQDYINGSGGSGSTWTVKSVTIDSGTSGFVERDCTFTFAATSATDGTFSATPFFCLVDGAEWSSAVTISGKYKTRGTSMVFFDYLGNDPGGVMNLVTGGQVAADASIDDDSVNLNSVYGYGHYVRARLSK